MYYDFFTLRRKPDFIDNVSDRNFRSFSGQKTRVSAPCSVFQLLIVEKGHLGQVAVRYMIFRKGIAAIRWGITAMAAGGRCKDRSLPWAFGPGKVGFVDP